MRYKIHKQYRLPCYNYANKGLYFVTICTDNRGHFFGEIQNGTMHLSQLGSVVEQCWSNIPSSSSYAAIDEFIIMPNHLHGIITITNDNERREIQEKRFQPEKRSLSIVVRNFKAAVTIQERKKNPEITIWQSRYYDRIIRGEKELNAIRNYIVNNPTQWERDKNNLDNLMM